MTPNPSNDKIIRETLLTAYLIKRLSQPIHESQAFLRGIIDGSGNIIKRPSTAEEHNAYTPIDSYIFKLKTILGSKLELLNHAVVLEKIVKNSELPIALYEKELQFKHEMQTVLNRFKTVCNDATKNGLPISTIEKIVLESL